MSIEDEVSRLMRNPPIKEFLQNTVRQDLTHPVGVFRGGLNTSILFQLGQEDMLEYLILRSPNLEEDRMKIVAQIWHEYEGIGATANGVHFRLRSILEQGVFMREAYLAGLKTLPYVVIDREAILLRFVQGIALNKYVQQDPSLINANVICKVLSHMTSAHNLGIVFGDRWTPNTIIKPDGDFIELDFDIELLGDHTTITSLELSQTLYHLMHFSRGKRKLMRGLITDFYTAHPHLLNSYNMGAIRRFIEGQIEYFWEMYEKRRILYEGMKPTYEEGYKLIDCICAIIGSSDRKNN